MQLTCPNCGARYEVAAGMVPPEGRHVQCTNCHTRWFEKPAARATLSEDEILSKLDRLAPGPGPRLVVAPPPPPPDVDVEPLEDEEEAAPEAEPVEAPAPDGERTGDPATGTTPTSGVEAAEAGRGDTGGAEVVRLIPAAPRAVAAPPRLTLDTRAEADPKPVPPARSRFGLGFGLALLLCGLGLAAYRFADPLGAQVPAAEPMLEGWETAVDGLRGEIAERIEGLR